MEVTDLFGYSHGGFDVKGLDTTLDLCCLPPECEIGNIEYKLKLINPSHTRFEHLVTQMKWRLREGHGEAIYEIGVEDKGMLVGLTESEVSSSLHTLYLMTEKLSASLTILRERIIEDGSVKRKALEILIRKVPDDQQSIELRVAVIGNSDVGKSTLLGVLTQGEVDNGRGSARLNLFRHRHEIQTGRTSSISRELLGFSSDGKPVTYNAFRTPEEICEASTKLITFIDLAGHQKYLRTTVFGLIGQVPHFAMLLISAVSGIAGTTREHFGLALALDVPIIIIVNKADLAESQTVRRTITELESLLKSPACKKIPLNIETEDDAITAASSMNSSNIIPIFTVSCLTGKGIKLLYCFLNVLPPCFSKSERENLMQSDSEFQIDETFNVSDIGMVVGGLLTSGIIRESDCFKIGPFQNGDFGSARITSVHRHKVPCRVVRAGESATLALHFGNESYSKQIRKGMVLIPLNGHLEGRFTCIYFQARIHILYHSSLKKISSGFQATCHIGNVRQTAVIVAIMGKKGLSTNETASLMFKFVQKPEYIKAGSRLLLRQGTSKALGHVIQVFPYTSPESSFPSNPQ